MKLPWIKEDYSFVLTQWFFLRAFAVIYLIAFLSLAVQIMGLLGSEGILPATEYLAAAEQYFGGQRFWRLPTLFWIHCSDGFLYFMVWGGSALAVLLFLNVAPRLILFLLWLFYLSLLNIGQVFLSFQWDILLLEVGFLSIFFAPGHIRPRLTARHQPSMIIIWLLRWILFRLMLQSGLAKILSQDETWRDLTALTYHYWTQPLPNVVSWFVHQMPLGFHKISCLFMFVIELLIPFLMFAGRKARLFCFIVFSGFQVILILTGNYTFFNHLAMVLGIVLLDDDHLRSIIPRRLLQRLKRVTEVPVGNIRRRLRWILYGCLAVIIFIVSCHQSIVFMFWGHKALDPLQKIVNAIAPWHSVNRYGLFAIMTKKRPEIVIEGSNDGADWQSYEFHCKPGRLDRAPGFVAPHQPRLDWQMWFAALGNYRNNPWLIKFMIRLLEGSEDVIDLLKHNPFEDKPPRFIRAVVYEYRFTDFSQLRERGEWWTRELKALYTPVLSNDQQ